MASLWLPLARYAEDQAHQVGNDTKFFYPNAYKYRDWVVEAFNGDLPYDQFVQLQLAADLIDGRDAGRPGGARLPRARARSITTATGSTVMADEWEDRVDTVAADVLGLTVACARCHDHKFDPIPTRDYYALAGVFASTRDGQQDAGRHGARRDDEGRRRWTRRRCTSSRTATPQDLNVFIRGNVERKGPVVPRRFLAVLSPTASRTPFTDGSGRLELAEAIASREQPAHGPRDREPRLGRCLRPTAGRARRATSAHSGERPTHPELLDDLAVRFMEQRLVGEVAAPRDRAVGDLPADRRDSDRASGGAIAGERAALADEPPAADGRAVARRHARRRRASSTGGRRHVAGAGRPGEPPAHALRAVSRLKLNDLLLLFDFPDANVTRRSASVTTTPLQKLFVLNSPFMSTQAKALAARLHGEAARTTTRRGSSAAYRLLFGRDRRAPTSCGWRWSSCASRRRPEMTRWEQYAQVLLASNELLFVD